jgi:hypothetical protein
MSSKFTWLQSMSKLISSFAATSCGGVGGAITSVIALSENREFLPVGMLHSVFRCSAIALSYNEDTRRQI